MSCWTHITACLSIETGIVANKLELKRRLKTILEKGPKITGSENDANVFVNIQGGYSWFMSRDCEHCKYASTLRDVTVDGEEYTECDGPKSHDCSRHYQTRIVISIQGDLRDRCKEHTQEEFDEFLKYLIKDCRFYIRDYALNIEGD